MRNAAVGGGVFFLAAPVIGAACVTALMYAIFLVSGMLTSGSSGFYVRMLPLLSVGVFFMGYGIPAGLTGIVMGWLGLRLSRWQTVSCGIAVGVSLTAGYALLTNYWLLGEASPAGIYLMTIPGAIVPSAVLSWWLHRRIERKSTNERDAAAAKAPGWYRRRKSLIAVLLVLLAAGKIYSDHADASRASRHIDQIRFGDTGERVRSILGNPTSISESCGGIDADQIAAERAMTGCGSNWSYGSFLHPKVEVLFEPNGRVGGMLVNGD
ncbi:hypothetical protein DID96_35005 [Burkholderia sp. Bp8963]|nr:hypothetical protein DID96_35005 [Burkholderia sp. Bp8963]